METQPINLENIDSEKTSCTLVSTMGNSWQIIPELYGFCNPQSGIYKHHTQGNQIDKLRQEYQVSPIDRIAIIVTDGETSLRAVASLKEWCNYVEIPLKVYALKGVEELATVQECAQMTDWTYRVILRESSISKRVYLSLAGGRKTMSADMQQAAHIFGCHLLLHVVNKDMNKDMNETFSKKSFTSPLPSELVSNIMPIVVSGKIPRDIVLTIPAEKNISPNEFPLEAKHPCLLQEVRSRTQDARNLLTNYTRELTSAQPLTNFRGLYALSPDIIFKLKNTSIGVNKSLNDMEIQWLRSLPKAELHCHFGGIANSSELIRIANANKAELLKWNNKSSDLMTFTKEVSKRVKNNDVASLKEIVPSLRELRYKILEVPKPLVVASFLSQFEGNAELLDQFIFGDYTDNNAYRKIGFSTYSDLGDLQGTGLLQSEASIREACRVLIDQTVRENIQYLELRCSPINYTEGELSAKKVVQVIMEELGKQDKVLFKLLFIATRNKVMSKVYEHVELCNQLLHESEEFRKCFAGFDLAGNESEMKPERLREAFLPLMEKCLKITIHAGEIEDANSIWQAVYHLNADRIGHGLTLREKPELIDRFIDRSITLEMCPSSNDQIIGFDKDYPLKEYLEKGVLVTVNTDNPGISRTNLTNEFLKAAQLTNGGLRLWDVYQIIYNTFTGAFCHNEEKQKLLSKAEKQILESTHTFQNYES